MLTHRETKAAAPLREVGAFRLLSGILALAVEAALMASLMLMAGLFALGSMICWAISRAGRGLWPKRVATSAVQPRMR